MIIKILLIFKWFKTEFRFEQLKYLYKNVTPHFTLHIKQCGYCLKIKIYIIHAGIHYYSFISLSLTLVLIFQRFSPLKNH